MTAPIVERAEHPALRHAVPVELFLAAAVGLGVLLLASPLADPRPPDAPAPHPPRPRLVVEAFRLADDVTDTLTVVLDSVPLYDTVRVGYWRIHVRNQ